jgi:hypothetical protein
MRGHPKATHPNELLPGRGPMHEQPLETMTAANVEEFDVWVFNASNLVVTVLPVQAPWNAATENYEINPSIE